MRLPAQTCLETAVASCTLAKTSTKVSTHLKAYVCRVQTHRVRETLVLISSVCVVLQKRDPKWFNPVPLLDRAKL